MTLPFDHIPPQNLEAERATLACCLQSEIALREVVEALEGPDDFYADRHRVLYGLIAELRRKGMPVDRATVLGRAEETGVLGMTVDREYLEELAGLSITLTHAPDYAGTVLFKARVRRSQENLRRLCEDCYDPDVDLEQVGIKAVRAVEDTPGKFEDIRLLGDVATERVALLRKRKRGEIIGRTTGFRMLDRATGGIEDGKLILIAARPSMGKTGFALEIGTRSAKQTGPVVLYVARDDSVEVLADRALISSAMVHGEEYRLNLLPESKWDLLAAKAEELQTVPIFATDRCHNADDIRKRVRWLQKKYRSVGSVVVDYLQLLEEEKRGGRHEQVSSISRALKRLAVDLQIPVIALSQLSRKVEERPDKRPMLSDLYESGQLEADAEIVMFLYREEYYLQREGKEIPPSKKGKVEIILAKQKNMPPCTVDMRFDPQWLKFTEFDWERGVPG